MSPWVFGNVYFLFPIFSSGWFLLSRLIHVCRTPSGYIHCPTPTLHPHPPYMCPFIGKDFFFMFFFSPFNWSFCREFQCNILQKRLVCNVVSVHWMAANLSLSTYRPAIIGCVCSRHGFLQLFFYPCPFKILWTIILSKIRPVPLNLM